MSKQTKQTAAVLLALASLGLATFTIYREAVRPPEKKAAAPVEPAPRAPTKSRISTGSALDGRAFSGTANECTNCNLILITVDTLRADHLSCYGYERKTSPRIDELAGESTLFENALSQWPRTSQSFASFLTGRYPSQTGVVALRSAIHEDNLLIAEILEHRGYYTAAFVANGNLGSEFNFDQGFEKYVELWKGKENGGQADSYAADAVNRSALAWLKQAPREPFFLWVHYIDPHGPYSAKEPYTNKFVGDAFCEGNHAIPRDRLRKYQWLDDETEIDVDRYIARYDGEIAFVDDEVGKLLDRIRELGLLDRSIVAFTSDHGESLDEHDFYFEHGKDLFNPGLHVPLLIRHPKLTGQRIAAPVPLLDLVPTVLDALGIDGDFPLLEGMSEGAAMVEGAKQPDRVFFAENRTHVAVMRGPYKLVRSRNGLAGALYEYLADPAESTEISDAESEKQLTEMTISFQRRTTGLRRNPVNEQQNVSSTDVSEETRKQLESLGYAE